MDSRFIKLNDYLILEYGNISKSHDYNYDIITNTYNDTRTFSPSYSSGVINSRDNGMERVDSSYSNKYKYLDVNVWGNPYFTDNNILIDDEKTPYIDLPYIYLRIHKVSGYTFNDVKGFGFNVNLRDTDDKPINLINFSYIVGSTSSEVFYPSNDPLYIDERYYDQYIELKLLSPEHILGDSDLLFIVDELTDNKRNINENTLVNINFSDIDEVELINLGDVTESNFVPDKVYLGENILRTTTPFDKNKQFGLVFQETGDYFSFFATYNGDFINTFIDNQAAQGEQWILFHRIETYEQVDYDNTRTGNVEYYQDSKFNEAMLYRPIIINSNIAYAFSLKLTTRFLNTNTNESFYKSAKLSGLIPRKYGRELSKINVSNMTQVDVFKGGYTNTQFTLPNSEVNQNNKEIVYNFIKTIDVVNGGIIKIQPFTNTYEFKFSDSIAIDVEWFLTFISDDGEKYYLRDFEKYNTDTSLFFKISESESKRVRLFSNNIYYIVGVNVNGEETVLMENNWIK